MSKKDEDELKNHAIIMTGRIRLARNLSEYPFETKLSDEGAKEMVQKILGVTDELSEKNQRKYYGMRISNLSETDRAAMVERHLISPDLAKKKQETGLILSEDEMVSILINEEDHVRIQVVVDDDIQKAYEIANEIDNITYEKLHYAYDHKYGYLTACPTNVGTGMRASYMLFLPALDMAGKLPRLIEEVGKYGITIRGFYGEGSKGLGSIYQISNQRTLGLSEQEILSQLNQMVRQVVKEEIRFRIHILQNNYEEFEDQIYKAYGILKYARRIGSAEAMELLAEVKLGIDLGIIEMEQEIDLFGLMMSLQPATLMWKIGKNIGKTGRDLLRAETIRNYLPEV